VFDKPGHINKGAAETQFAYGIGNTRYQRIDRENGVVQKTTLYFGSTERITEGASTLFKRYLGGVAIATFYPATQVQQLNYLLKDHIGSIHTITNKNGQIVATMHFGAFGERQGNNWQTPLTSGQWVALNDITTRGFTGHEQIDEMGLVHMNGRVYDPKLGRFLQADPFVQALKNSQSLNRYSYVLNNPLSYTDPSGFFIKELVAFAINLGRVIVNPQDTQAWHDLIASGVLLLNSLNAQQNALPPGVMAGSFTNGFTIATSNNAGPVRNDDEADTQTSKRFPLVISTVISVGAGAIVGGAGEGGYAWIYDANTNQVFLFAFGSVGISLTTPESIFATIEGGVFFAESPKDFAGTSFVFSGTAAAINGMTIQGFGSVSFHPILGAPFISDIDFGFTVGYAVGGGANISALLSDAKFIDVISIADVPDDVRKKLIGR